MGLAHLDSGALYRTVALVALDDGVPLEGGGESIVEAARARKVELRDVSGEFLPMRAGLDVSQQIRSTRVTEYVSAVAALPPVREWVNQALRGVVARHSRGVVADGRDIGTVVFPDAGLKIFLTASLDERARRRAGELSGDEAVVDLKGLAEDMRRRDEADSSRAVAPLEPAPDAIHIDTTELTFDDQVAAVIELAEDMSR